jgi:sulfur-oxidizing protein SoxX
MKRVVSLAIGGVAVALAGIAGAETAPADVQIVDNAVAGSLTGQPGDAAKGRELTIDRRKGNCLACHVNSDASEQQFHGEIGPPLDGAGSRWSEAELRAIIVNSKAVFGEQTIMPGFYRVAGLNRVAEKFEGTTILTAQEVEDVIAYLQTLKD